ncbi:SH3 domain-containing protein [Pseudalkalibacillus sp. R45]|uniref:SH3 domain-containing protein n=1 Tax=Pseudalkalibacillus sp. R45 TaxID=3457433 RepID=UPI003FCD2474
MNKKNDNEVFIVAKEHLSNHPNPIKLFKGQSVFVGEKYNENEDWDNWIYCYTTDKSLEGWVPDQIIENDGKQGVILEDYIARELDVKVGEKLLKQKELNGWFWVKNLGTSEEGWVPKENVKKQKS